jgi:hypothetical protein
VWTRNQLWFDRLLAHLPPGEGTQMSTPTTPTEEAMKAAHAINRINGLDLTIAPSIYAASIDRETGLPQLLAERDELADEVKELLGLAEMDKDKLAATRKVLENLLKQVENLRVPQTTDEAQFQFHRFAPVIQAAREVLGKAP